jgi:hypothetical protein
MRGLLVVVADAPQRPEELMLDGLQRRFGHAPVERSDPEVVAAVPGCVRSAGSATRSPTREPRRRHPCGGTRAVRGSVLVAAERRRSRRAGRRKLGGAATTRHEVPGRILCA